MCPTTIPITSARMMLAGDPSIKEKPSRTYGRYGAVKGNTPKKLRGTVKQETPRRNKKEAGKTKHKHKSK